MRSSYLSSIDASTKSDIVFMTCQTLLEEAPAWLDWKCPSAFGENVAVAVTQHVFLHLPHRVSR